MNKNPANKVESMILCGAVWDSLGIPVEMQTKEQIQSILEKFKIGWKKITQFLPPILHKLYREWSYNHDAKVISSDDTYCTRAAMQSLCENQDINFEDIMNKNLDFFHQTDFWYGGTTKQAYEKFEQGVDIHETGSNGWWNGVIMKLAPLSTYLLAKWYPQKDVNRYLDEFTKMTHTHESVVNGTKVHHMFLTYLLQNTHHQHISWLLQDMFDFCITHESKQNTIPLSPVIDKLIALEKSGEIYNLSDDKILEYFGWWDEKITSVSWRIDITIWMCYAVFLRNPNINGIIDAVSIWWDTDTYGAIVWNMVWAYTWDRPRNRSLNQIPDIQILQKETQQFIELLRKI